MSLLLFLFVSLISCAYLYLIKIYNYWKDLGVPYETPSFITGNLNGVRKYVHLVKRLQEVYERFKNDHKICGFYFCQQPKLIILDLDLIKNILIKDFNYFDHRGLYHNEKDDPLSAHLFFIKGDKWRTLRNKLTGSFTSSKTKMMFPIVAGYSNGLVNLVNNKLSNVNGIDIKQVCIRYTTDVIGSCGFGIECNALKDENCEMLKITDIFDYKKFETSARLYFTQSFPELSLKLGIKLTPNDVNEFFMRIIKQTYDYRLENDVDRNDFMSLLIQIQKYGKLKDDDVELDEDETMTFNELAAQAFIFFAAGFEASSKTMQLALYELAYRQEIQDQLRAEISLVTEKTNNEITYEGLLEMSYLDQIVKETLRLYSPVDKLLRTCIKDYKVPDSNFVIEKGTKILIPVYSIHHDSRFYYDPEVFDPERFCPEETRKRSKNAFLSFGDGPRNCIGSRFALMQTKFGIATIIRNFKFKLNKETSYPLVLNAVHLLMNPIKAILLDAEKVTTI
ncbi:unnamed protein product [Diamesa serratosioi]